MTRQHPFTTSPAATTAIAGNGTATMRRLREAGHTLREIADMTGVSYVTVFNRIGGQKRGAHSGLSDAANDNRKTIEVAHNGGCSTLSGMVRVTVARSAGKQVAA